MTPADYFKAMIFIAPALCSTVCAVFVAMLLRDYRNSGESRTRITAVILSLIISVLWIAPPVLGWRPAPGAPWVLFVVAALALTLPAFQVWVTWRIIRKGRPDTEKPPLAAEIQKNLPFVGTIEPDGGGELTKKRLEEYFERRRPFLDPEFKLADLAEAMDVNRSEMSAFVNRTFETGFKRYVNRWRLAEYERLMALPSNELKNPYRVVKMAGFTDTRHYHRVVALEKAPRTTQKPTPEMS